MRVSPQLLRFLIAILFVWQLPAEAAATETAWRLKQYAYEIGNLEVLAGTTGAKVICMRGQCSITTQKPTWDVVIYNSKDKRGLKISRKDWNHGGINWIGSNRKYFDEGKETSKKVSFLGFPATRHDVKASFTRTSQSGKVWQTESKKTQIKVISVSYTDLDSALAPCPQEVTEFMKCFFKTPRGSHFPMEIVYTKEDMGKDYILSTSSCKRVQVPSNTFNCETGFAIAPSAEACVFGRTMENILEEMLK